jgi:hypothetical protein
LIFVVPRASDRLKAGQLPCFVLRDAPGEEGKRSVFLAGFQGSAANQSTADGKIGRAVELAATLLEAIRRNRNAYAVTVWTAV